MQQFQEYPKWVAIPGTEAGGVVVFSKEEENGLQKEGAVPTETAAKVTRKRKATE